MTWLLDEFHHPRLRERVERVRVGREGKYWQTADGLVVNLSSTETSPEAEATARSLLELAVAYARGR